MLAKVKSFGLNGIEGYLVDIEIDLNSGMPSYETVGLPDTAVKEGKERIRSAIKNSGLKFPIIKITVNLAPADTKKEGSIYDLATAIGLLMASNQVDCEKAMEYAYIGELSLDGSVRHINGVLPILISAHELGIKKVIVPQSNAMEASFIEGVEIYAVSNLKQVVDFINGETNIEPLNATSYEQVLKEQHFVNDFKYVKGQSQAKRALEIAAAGGHNVLMIGPSGAGKTMLAKCFSSILPDMTFGEALESTKLHSIAGILDNKEGIVTKRPFRSPHHTATLIALTGGGTNAKPGEISLAHNGVLFLDELPEYNRRTIETLRQPLEDGKITIARNKMTVEYPANFTLIASMNPCPCGYYGSLTTHCRCTPSQIYNYLNKLSGPLMDRIDMHIEVDGITYDELKEDNLEESSADIKIRVNKARQIQIDRYKNDNIYSNSEMTAPMIQKFCKLDEDSELLLKDAFENLNLSARGHNRILKVARTIADLEESPNIKFEHIAEAIGYRTLDKKYTL